jgi:hypothetical protein
VVETGGSSYELFWDDADRLIAVQCCNTIRWHYHYLGNALLAITQEWGAAVKRFWIVSDERGLIYRVLDDQAATHLIQRWDASGWRNIVASYTPPHAPFGLAGQYILYGSGTYEAAIARPDIALNHWRAYDPLLSAFLSPDERDQRAQLAPEGYVYGRSNPVLYVDFDGSSSRARNQAIAPLLSFISVNDACSGREKEDIEGAIWNAVDDIQKCRGGPCAYAPSENFRRRWIYSLLTGSYDCKRRGWYNSDYKVVEATDAEGHGLGEYIFENKHDGKHAGAFSAAADQFLNASLSPAALGQNPEVGGVPCLEQAVAHEAMHWVNAHTVTWETYGPTVPRMIVKDWLRQRGGLDPEEEEINRTVGNSALPTEGCVKCGP